MKSETATKSGGILFVGYSGTTFGEIRITVSAMTLMWFARFSASNPV